MIEYIFFDASLQNKFVEYAASLGIACTSHNDQMGMVVAVPEDIGENQENALEQCYDQLQDKQADLLAQEEGGFKRLAGFRYTLPDGQSRLVPLPTDTANRLLSVFSIEEIQALFATVARSALSREEKSLCKVLADDAPPASD